MFAADSESSPDELSVSVIWVNTPLIDLVDGQDIVCPGPTRRMTAGRQRDLNTVPLTSIESMRQCVSPGVAPTAASSAVVKSSLFIVSHLPFWPIESAARPSW